MKVMFKYILLIVSILFISVGHAEVIRCKFGSVEYTIVMPYKENHHNVITAQDTYTEQLPEEYVSTSIDGIAKVIGQSEWNGIVHRGGVWMEVIWFPYDKYSSQIIWDRKGNVQSLGYDDGIPIPGEKTKKGYAELRHNLSHHIKGVCN